MPLIALALAGSSPVFAQTSTTTLTTPDAASIAVAHDLLNVMYPSEQREHTFKTIMETMMRNIVAGAQQARGGRADPRADDIVNRFISVEQADLGKDLKENLPGLFDAYANAYARIFSLEELKAVRTFAVTPAGAHFLQRSAGLLSDPDVMRWQRDQMAREVQRLGPHLQTMKRELDALAKDKSGG